MPDNTSTQLLENPNDLTESLIPYEKRQIHGFHVYEGIVKVFDMRLSGLPLISSTASAEETMVALKQSSGIKVDKCHRPVRVRFLWGAEFPSQVVSCGATEPLDRLWNYSVASVTDGDIGVDLFEPDPQKASLSHIIDYQISNPDLPITIIIGHGYISTPDQRANDWVIAVQDPRTKNVIKDVSVSEVREEIEKIDMDTYSQKNRGQKPPPICDYFNFLQSRFRNKPTNSFFPSRQTGISYCL